MPQINRIRIANIKYDNEKKEIHDLMFEAKGHDTLLILANGGGKSLLVQLILQVILPNTKMGKRKVEDLLLSGQYSGHVAVEWLLEAPGEHQQFLCTGFCFGGGQSSERSIRYYNYLFDYDDRSALTIEALPLIYADEKDGAKRPIQFQRLKDWLREKGIQPIDRTETYQERLRIYRILPEEWKNIRDTNGSEGGVDKFFEKSRTTRQLMDNLLIPSVEEMIFQDEQKKGELVHAFAQHREMLLEIPVIKQNLSDFALIRDAAEGVVEKVGALDLLQKEFESGTKEIVKLSRSFYAFSEAAQKDLEALGGERETAAEKCREVEWQERSYKWFLKTLELSEAENIERQAADAYLKSNDRLQEAMDKEKQLNARYYFNEAEKARQEELVHRNDLELMERAEPELQSLLKDKKKIQKAAWKEKRVELHALMEAREKNLAELRKEKEALKDKQAAARAEQSVLYTKNGALENWLDAYRQQRQALLTIVATEEALDPAGALGKRQGDLELLEQREQELAVSKGELASKIEVAGQKILKLMNERTCIEAENRGIREKLDQFQSEADALRGSLAGNGIFVQNLLAEKEGATLRVRDILAGIQEKKLGLQAELANLQEKWALVEGRDYYVSHHDLLRIKSRLERAGIYVVLGSEWLAGQPLSEAKKKELLQRQPLLPFAVLIEANQVNAVKHVVRQVKEWTCDVPLLFLVKTGDCFKGEGFGEDFVSLWQEELFLFRPGSIDVYTSLEVFQELKSRLQAKIKAKEEETKEEINRETNFISFQEGLFGFFLRYPWERVRGWEKKECQLQGDLSSLEQEIISGEEQKTRDKEELFGFENALGETAQEKQKLHEIIGKIRAFHELHLLYPVKTAAGKDLKGKLEKIASWLAETEQRLSDISGQEYEMKSGIRELKGTVKNHEDDFARYRLEEITSADEMELGLCIPVAYEYVRIEVDGILNQLQEKQGERANIQKLLDNAGKQVENFMYEVEKTGIEVEWLAKSRRLVTRAEIKEAGGTAKEYRLLSDDKKKAWDEAKVILRTRKNMVENNVSEIRELFGRAPYEGFSEEAHDLEIASIRQRKGELQGLVEKLSARITAKGDWQRETWDAYESAMEKMQEEIRHLWEQVTPYSYEEWMIFREKPRRILERREGERNAKGVQIERQKYAVTLGFESYLAQLETTKNMKVRQFIRDVKAIMAENRLYDYGFVQDQFLRIFEGLEMLETQYNNTLVESEKNKGHLVNLCLRRAGSVYDSVIEIPKSSRVSIYDREIQVIRLDWPRREETEAGERMNGYIEQSLEDLLVLKQQGKKDDEINGIMETKMKTKNLIEQIAPMENCRVTVYKPRKETMIRYGRPEYAPWDEVPKWSGGEEYSVYVTMFMIMLTHIRQQSEGRRDVWKVLVADNPFGKASSPHVWEPVFQIAKANRIQLICLTAHKPEDILKRFPVVYSLQLRSAFGKEIMRAEQMESGFYRLDTASDDGAQVMLPI